MGRTHKDKIIRVSNPLDLRILKTLYFAKSPLSCKKIQGAVFSQDILDQRQAGRFFYHLKKLLQDRFLTRDSHSVISGSNSSKNHYQITPEGVAAIFPVIHLENLLHTGTTLEKIENFAHDGLLSMIWTIDPSYLAMEVRDVFTPSIVREVKKKHAPQRHNFFQFPKDLLDPKTLCHRHVNSYLSYAILDQLHLLEKNNTTTDTGGLFRVISLRLEDLSDSLVDYDRPFNKFLKFLKKMEENGLLRIEDALNPRVEITPEGRLVRRMQQVLAWGLENLTQEVEKVMGNIRVLIHDFVTPTQELDLVKLRRFVGNLFLLFLNADPHSHDLGIAEQDIYQALDVAKPGPKPFVRGTAGQDRFPVPQEPPSELANHAAISPERVADQEIKLPQEIEEIPSRPIENSTFTSTDYEEKIISPLANNLDALEADNYADFPFQQPPGLIVQGIPGQNVKGLFIEACTSYFLDQDPPVPEETRNHILQEIEALVPEARQALRQITIQALKKQSRNLIKWSRLHPDKRVRDQIKAEFQSEIEGYVNEVIT